MKYQYEFKEGDQVVNGYLWRHQERGSGYYSQASGRSYTYLQCPFCNTANIKAFIWSLSGGGKKCPECKAVLSSRIARLTITPEIETIFNSNKQTV